MKKITILLLFLVTAFGYGQVSSYTFGQAIGTYTEITSGTIVGTATSDDQRFVDPATPAGGTVLTGPGLPIGFDFTFNGAVYDVFAINNNGWISLGSSFSSPAVNNASTSSYLPISSVVAFSQEILASKISALGKDLQAQTGSELSYETIGTAPNRVLVVQWKNYRKYLATGENFNFQIRLNETSNTVEIVYGTFVSNAATGQTFEVGLRAAPSTAASNFANRTSTTDWAATTAGATGTASVLMNNTIIPTNGLTFTWTPPACNAPLSAVASVITNSTATITWNIPVPNPDGYEYVVTSTNTLPVGSGTESVSSTADVTLLTANTPYFIFLRSKCGTDFSNWFLAGTFSTLCNDVTTFSENFDSYTTTGVNVLANCWSRAGNAVSGYVTTGGVAPGSTPNRLYMTASGLTPTVSYAIMPPVSNLQANTNRLRFKAYSSTAADRPLEVGYFTNSDDTETFVLLETFNLPGTAASSATTFTLIPSAIPAGVNRLVFRNAGIPTGTTTLYIDDVVWEVMPLCGDITGLNVNEITSESALIYWEPGDSITAWQYAYGVSTVTDPNTLTPVNVIDNPFDTVSGLEASTTYKYWVRSNCNGNFGAWAGPFSFTTLCAAETPNYTENFASFPPVCWSRASAGTVETGPTNTSDGIWLADGFLNSGTTGAIKVNLYLNNRIGWMISPTIDLSDPEDYIVNFDYAVTTWNQTTPSVMGSDDTVKLLISEDNGVTWTEMISLGAADNVSNATQTASLVINSSSATTKFAFLATDGTVDDLPDYDFFIDNFKVEVIPECAAPTGVSGIATSDTTAVISWNESITIPANGYEYYVNTVNETPAETVTPTGSVAAGVTTANLNTLAANTVHYVWVRSVCSGVLKSVWSEVASFKTDCVPATTFAENFDSYTTTGVGSPMPDCWKRAGSGSTYITTGSIAPATAPNRLYMNANGATPSEAFAIMPPVSNLQAGTHRLKFKAYATAADRYLEIGYFGDISDITTYILLETINLTTTSAATAEDYIYIPAGVPAGINSLVFRNPGTPTAATTLYIDNVVWESLPLCPDVTELMVDAVAPNSANISWMPGGSETAWQYVYGESTVTDPNTLVPVGVSNNPQDVITGLTPSTAYKYWVRSVCGTDLGSWSDPMNFVTPCLPISTLPWNEGFEGLTTVGLTSFPGCWFKQNGDWRSANNAASTFDIDARTGDKFIAIAWSATNEFIWTPGFQLTAGENYDLSFWYASYGNYSSWNGDVFYNTAQNSTDATLMSTFISTGTQAPSTYTKVNNTFTPDTDGIYYFAIRVNESTGSPWYLSFDDFTLDLTPSCAAPGGLLASNVTFNSATITWTESVSMPDNGYQYYRSESSTPPTSTTVPTGSVGEGINTVNFTDLSATTTYYVWVRSFCATDEFSEWTSAVSFTTTCAPSPIPFAESFATFVPACWSTAAAGTPATGPTGTGAGIWLADGFLNSGTTGAIKVNLYDINRIGWLISPVVDLSENPSHTVSFNYGVTTWNLTTPSAMQAGDMVKLLMSENNGTTWTEIVSFDASSNVSNTSQTFTAEITATSPTTKFAFYATDGTVDGPLDYDFFIDNFDVSETLRTPGFDHAAFKAYPNPVRDILNLSYSENISNVEVFNLLGQQVVTKSVNANQGQVDLSNLASGTYLVKVTANDVVKTIKVIKQ